MLKKVNRSDLGPIDQSFDIFGPVVRLTNSDKHTKYKNVSNNTMNVAKKVFGDHVVSCFATAEASIYMPILRRNLVFELL